VKVRLKAFAEARVKLVEELKSKGIYDMNVLEAFRNIPRHIFVPDVLIFDSYKNVALPIGYGQTISQPFTVAFMTQELEIESHHKVLEIGTGSGFQTAILAFLSKSVYTVEIIEIFSQNAQQAHQRLDISNIFYKVNDGVFGWDSMGRFDRIIYTAALFEHPEKLYDQLVNDGIMIYPFINSDASQNLCKVVKRDGKVLKKMISPCNFVLSV